MSPYKKTNGPPKSAPKSHFNQKAPLQIARSTSYPRPKKKTPKKKKP